MWEDFLSPHFWFYEVIIFKGIYVIGEKKMQSVYVNIKLRLKLKTNSLFPMHHLWFGFERYIFKVQILQILELYVKLSLT